MTTSKTFATLAREALAARIDDIAVLARVSPTHKVRTVRALEAVGHMVAMTGDGVNDAPALKAADSGVALGIAGTAVTREAATVLLLDEARKYLGKRFRAHDSGR